MKITRILKFIVINLAVFAILLAALNWACGVYLQKTGKSDRAELPNYTEDREHAHAVFADYNRIQHQYEPFTGWKTRPYTGKTTNIGDNGLRAVPGNPSEHSQRKIVRFFGGSTMWGEGSDDGHTIPGIFSRLNPEFDVYNHGQLAYNSRQELDALISVYAKSEKTDVVIFYDGVNDAAFLCPKEITELPAHRLVPMYREKLYTGKFALVTELVYKIFMDDIINLVQKVTYKPSPENSPYDCIQNPEKAEAIAEMMIKNWEMAHEIVTERGGEFYAVLQPAAFISNPRTDHLKLDEELGRNFNAIYGRLKEKIADRQHPWIIDLSNAFDGDQYIFIDFCHVSPNGNEIIARNISARVVIYPRE